MKLQESCCFWFAVLRRLRNRVREMVRKCNECDRNELSKMKEEEKEKSGKPANVYIQYYNK